MLHEIEDWMQIVISAVYLGGQFLRLRRHVSIAHDWKRHVERSIQTAIVSTTNKNHHKRPYFNDIC